ncbi:DUF4436 domain-containing protein [Embleya scabrispora]|uniref:DUF4436 domain-containing protein n=1 Tax=Embleya scabrispora TaxID=159449 RepID=A0A1T3NIE7_9ACTN|nr:DUF4436 family protein [Embleya scabrispora]OPC76562.1 DUF4436 domain-containing protein [Embleya scabrispora]
MVVALILAVGVWMQVGERIALDTTYHAPNPAPDRIDVRATVQRVDAAARELTLRVMVTPRGRLAEEDGLLTSQDLVLRTSQDVRGDLTFPAHTRVDAKDVPVALAGGAVTDYPFDEYATDIAFSATADGAAVPVSMTLVNVDALFAIDVDAANEHGVAGFDLGVQRSRTVLLFAVFMIVAMWALAIAVFIGAKVMVGGRRGLVWPALGWMAATLFALAAFRNTAPGNPPIGSLLDYLAFLWAEAIVAICLTAAVFAGAVVESRTDAGPA